MSKLRNQVYAFMTTFSQPTREEPGTPPEDVIRLRARLVVEEVFEMLHATFDMRDRNEVEALELLEGSLHHGIRTAPIRVDLPELADAFADIDYVVEGARLAFGINGEPIADEVHRANMAKHGGPVVDGKQLKPAGWTPPDVARLLVEQGWRP
jgi:predicted HAD superfamily Cof-like phosphohydrolase